MLATQTGVALAVPAPLAHAAIVPPGLALAASMLGLLFGLARLARITSQAAPNDAGTWRLGALTKDWGQHVVEAEEVARRPAFRDLRDRIVARAAPQPQDDAVDIGSGTGLLTLVLAERVKPGGRGTGAART